MTFSELTKTYCFWNRVKYASPLLIMYSTLLYYIIVVACGLRTEFYSIEKVYLFLSAFVITFLFGKYDALQTSRKDNPSRMKEWTYSDIDYSIHVQSAQNEDYRESVKKTYDGNFRLWFVGGNKWYAPGSMFRSDFWHYMKFMWISCIPGIAISSGLSMSMSTGWWDFLYIFLFNVEGTTFTVQYWWRTRKDVTWEQFYNMYFKGGRIYT
jgi:hypothetical protein